MQTKIILNFLFFFLLYTFALDAQNKKTATEIHKDKNGKEYQWTKVSKKNKSGFDCFYYRIERTKSADKNGFYDYFIYFLSNSNIGKKRVSTNIDDLRVYFNEEQKDKHVASEPYILVKPKSEDFNGKYLGLKTKSKKKDEIIVITWKNYLAY